MDIIKFIDENKETFFGGLGVLILTGIVAFFKKNVFGILRDRSKKKKINKMLDDARSCYLKDNNLIKAKIIYESVLSLDSNNERAKIMLNKIICEMFMADEKVVNKESDILQIIKNTKCYKRINKFDPWLDILKELIFQRFEEIGKEEIGKDIEVNFLLYFIIKEYKFLDKRDSMPKRDLKELQKLFKEEMSKPERKEVLNMFGNLILKGFNKFEISRRKNVIDLHYLISKLNIFIYEEIMIKKEEEKLRKMLRETVKEVWYLLQ